MIFLHSMIRTNCPEESIRFYTEGLGLKLISEKRVEKGEFTLYFLGENKNSPMVELTHNWDGGDYVDGTNFGHMAFEVDDIYETCEKIEKAGVVILRPPRDGYMAFIKDPNGISIEFLQKGEALIPRSPWKDMTNTGAW